MPGLLGSSVSSPSLPAFWSPRINLRVINPGFYFRPSNSWCTGIAVWGSFQVALESRNRTIRVGGKTGQTSYKPCSCPEEEDGKERKAWWSWAAVWWEGMEWKSESLECLGKHAQLWLERKGEILASRLAWVWYLSATRRKVHVTAPWLGIFDRISCNPGWSSTHLAKVIELVVERHS